MTHINDESCGGVRVGIRKSAFFSKERNWRKFNINGLKLFAAERGTISLLYNRGKATLTEIILASVESPRLDLIARFASECSSRATQNQMQVHVDLLIVVAASSGAYNLNLKV